MLLRVCGNSKLKAEGVGSRLLEHDLRPPTRCCSQRLRSTDRQSTDDMTFDCLGRNAGLDLL